MTSAVSNVTMYSSSNNVIKAKEPDIGNSDAAPSRQPPKSMKLIRSRALDVVLFLKGSEFIKGGECHTNTLHKHEQS